jgi:hypothetical protein
MRMTVLTIAVGFRLTRQKTNLLNIAVHALLQEGIEPGTFRLDLADIRQFGFQADAELMGGITGQTDFFAVVGFE